MKFRILVLALILVSGPSVFGAPLMSDFNADGTVNMNDIACWFGYYQLLQLKTPTISEVITQAQSVRKSLPSNFATALPDVTLMDVDSATGTFNINDIAMAFGWFQYVSLNGSATMDASAIKTLAQSVRKSLATTMEKFPGLEIGSSTIPITIGGITPN